MFRYGTIQYKPLESPQIKLHISSRKDLSSSVPVDAIVDTGAVMTCVPEKLIKRIGGDRLGYSVRQISSVGAKRHPCKTYFINLKVAKCEFRNIEVVAVDREYAILGRDILNQYSVTFDGPSLRWEVDADCG